MDLVHLRDRLRTHIIGLMSHTHANLPGACERLALPALPLEGSKREKLTASFQSLPDASLPLVAERILKFHSLTALDRNALQDLLWADTPAPEIPKKYRRVIARVIDIHELYMDADRFDRLLSSLWVLDDDPVAAILGGGDRSLRAGIARHVHRNPGDWSTEDLFDKLGAFEASDLRFVLFLEGLASSDVLPDETAQRRFVETVNGVLSGYGVELRESGTAGGYPVFSVISTRTGGNRSPKNLIFASPEKPDIRFRSAVDNDIEIVSNADKVLVYDRPIGADGLRWRDLQRWWATMQGIEDEKVAKRSLYLRLRGSLPDTSPPQILLFDSFYKGFGKAIPDLPALLPEVWLHWDPKTVKERGPDALLRFRMDFLLLLPHGTRVVLEVDGRQHYATEDGRADTARYANMVEADRELKLSGYEVFRFGGAELQGEPARDMVKSFFSALFARYSVLVPPAG
jgi:very-short-patch-repair endonuclease